MFCIRAVTEPSEPRPADPAMDSLERGSSNQKKHRRLPKLVAAQARTMFGLSAAVEPSRHGQTVPAANAPERVRQRKTGSRFFPKMTMSASPARTVSERLPASPRPFLSVFRPLPDHF